jgi:glycosyltransferase involved in cell wall biosynthesis
MKFCFVAPRYFDGIAGGAETLIAGLAHALQARGDEVEILTTCAKDNRTWADEFEPGETIVNRIKVTRFKVDERDLDRWIPIQCAIHEGTQVSVNDQMTWMSESVNSKALYAHLVQRRDDFDAIFFGPYLFGTTFWGSLIAPEKSILIPCLHDESYAYLEVIGSMFRQVRGCLFNAEPEMYLARSLYGDIGGGVVGMGFDVPTREHVESLSPYFEDSCPYILYLGRKETGKNVHRLIDYFCAAKNDGLIPPEVKLAILGGGSFSDLHRPEAVSRGDIIDLPHLSEIEKQRLLRHALYLCQPSTNESFSIVLMEAWMVGTPVAVHGECAVTRHHVVKSGGGLYFSSAPDLAGVTRHFLDNPEMARTHAELGRRYVEREYSWGAVLDRFDAVVRELAQGREAVAEDNQASVDRSCDQ